MSIIYEALKKVERAGAPVGAGKNEKAAKAKSGNYLIYILVILAGVALTNLAFSIFSRSAAKPRAALKTPSPAPTVITPSKPKPAPPLPGAENAPSTEAPEAKILDPESFKLNGIFFSEDEAYALINNQVVKTGDSIGGGVVEDITVDTVVIGSEGENFTLTTGRK